MSIPNSIIKCLSLSLIMGIFIWSPSVYGWLPNFEPYDTSTNSPQAKDVVLHIDSFWLDTYLNSVWKTAELEDKQFPLIIDDDDDNDFNFQTGGIVRNFNLSTLHYAGIDFYKGTSFKYTSSYEVDDNDCIGFDCRANLIFYTDELYEQLQPDGRDEIGEQRFYVRVPIIIRYDEDAGVLKIYRNCDDANFPDRDNKHPVAFDNHEEPPDSWEAHLPNGDALPNDSVAFSTKLTEKFLSVPYDNNELFGLDNISIDFESVARKTLNALSILPDIDTEEIMEGTVEGWEDAVEAFKKMGYYPPSIFLRDPQLTQRNDDHKHLFLGFSVRMLLNTKFPVNGYIDDVPSFCLHDWYCFLSPGTYAKWTNQFKKCDENCFPNREYPDSGPPRWQWKNPWGDNTLFHSENYEFPAASPFQTSGHPFENSILSVAVDADLTKDLFHDFMMQFVYHKVLKGNLPLCNRNGRNAVWFSIDYQTSDFFNDPLGGVRDAWLGYKLAVRGGKVIAGKLATTQVVATGRFDYTNENHRCLIVPKPRIAKHDNGWAKFLKEIAPVLDTITTVLTFGSDELRQVLSFGLIEGDTFEIPDDGVNEMVERMAYFKCFNQNLSEIKSDLACSRLASNYGFIRSQCIDALNYFVENEPYVFFPVPGQELNNNFKSGIGASLYLPENEKWILSELMGASLPDFDGDGLRGSQDLCPHLYQNPFYYPDWTDHDTDNHPDICDNCPPVSISDYEHPVLTRNQSQSNFDYLAELHQYINPQWNYRDELFDHFIQGQSNENLYEYLHGDKCDDNDDNDYWTDGGIEFGRHQFMTECESSSKRYGEPARLCDCQANYQHEDCLKSLKGIVCWNNACICDCDYDYVEEVGDGGTDDEMTPNWASKGFDNCPRAFNPSQSNCDNDWLGDECDNCPYVGNVDQSDEDFDTVGDVCDNCSEIPNKQQLNFDLESDDSEDPQGNVCDPDPMAYLQLQLCNESQGYELSTAIPYYGLIGDDFSRNFSVVIQYCDCERLVFHHGNDDDNFINQTYNGIDREDRKAVLERCQETICRPDHDWTFNSGADWQNENRFWKNIWVQKRVSDERYEDILFPSGFLPQSENECALNTDIQLMGERASNPCPVEFYPDLDIFTGPDYPDDLKEEGNTYFCSVCFSSYKELGTPAWPRWDWERQLIKERKYREETLDSKRPLVFLRISYTDTPYIDHDSDTGVDGKGLKDHMVVSPSFQDVEDLSEYMLDNVCLKDKLARLEKFEAVHFDILDPTGKIQLLAQYTIPPYVDPPIDYFLERQGSNLKRVYYDAYSGNALVPKEGINYQDFGAPEISDLWNSGIDSTNLVLGLESTILFGGATTSIQRGGDRSAVSKELTNALYRVYRYPGQEVLVSKLSDNRDDCVDLTHWDPNMWICPKPLEYPNVFGLGLHQNDGEDKTTFSENSIVLFGGLDESGQCKNNYLKYEENEWSFINTSKYGSPSECFADGAKLKIGDGKYYVAGGRLSSTELSDKVYQFSVRDLNWTELPSLPEGHARAGASLLYNREDKKLYLFGGVTSDGKFRNDVLLLDLDPINYTAEWQVLVEQCEAENCPEGRAYAGFSKHPALNGLIIFGGAKELREDEEEEEYYFYLDLDDIDSGWKDLSGHQIFDCNGDGVEERSNGMKCRKERKDWYDPIGQKRCNYAEGEMYCNVEERSSRWAGTYITLAQQYKFDLKDDYAYIGSDFGLDIVFIGIDYLPIRIGWWPTRGRVRDVSIQSGKRLYLVDEDGIKLLDVGFTLIPVLKNQIDFAAQGVALEVNNNEVFVIAGNNLEVVERVGDWSLNHITTMNFDISCYDIVRVENKLYIGCESGIKVVDVDDFHNPLLRGTLYTEKPVTHLRADDTFLYNILLDGTYEAYNFAQNGILLTAGEHNVDHWVQGVTYESNKVFWINWRWFNIRKYD